MLGFSFEAQVFHTLTESFNLQRSHIFNYKNTDLINFSCLLVPEFVKNELETFVKKALTMRLSIFTRTVRFNKKFQNLSRKRFGF